MIDSRNFCKCGCGEKVKGNSSQFKQGHNLRLCNPATRKEVRIKISNSLKEYSKKEENIQKRSNRMKEVFIAKEVGKKISKSLKKYYQKEENKVRQTEAMKKLWQDPIYRENQIQKRKGHIVSEQTRQKMREFRKSYFIPLETRQKMSRSAKGRKYSLRRNEHMKIKMKQNWQKLD